MLLPSRTAAFAYRKLLVVTPFTFIFKPSSSKALMNILSEYMLKSTGAKMHPCLTPLVSGYLLGL